MGGGVVGEEERGKGGRWEGEGWRYRPAVRHIGSQG